MTLKPNLDEVVRSRAAAFASAVVAASKKARKEEEVRIAVVRELQTIEKEAGIELEGFHEFTLAKGRVDSVYDRVLIEYKNPASPSARIGTSLDSPGAKKVVAQLKERFEALQHELGQPLQSLFGVGTDGIRFVFLRYRGGKWQVEAPIEITTASAHRFLWALFNLGIRGKPFSSDLLASDFGSGSTLAQAGVRTLYNTIVNATHPKAVTLFSQWRILYTEVCGYDVARPNDKLKTLARAYGIADKGLKPAELLFALHTYYALFMKLLAAELVCFFHKLPSPLEQLLNAPSDKALRERWNDIEAGSIFRHFNIVNFLEGDLFTWYLSEWSKDLVVALRALVDRLDNYNPGTISEEPTGSRDLLKELYQELFPRSVRHDLGEYYTPDWLAEHVLDEAGYTGDPSRRLLDPACGSGTFMVAAINRARQWFGNNREAAGYDEKGLVHRILTNVVGFDLNPLAVMAARTNVLIAIRDLLSYADRVELPVYLCDAILTPSTQGGLFEGSTATARELRTAAGRFIIPTEIATDQQLLARYCDQMEACTRNGYSSDEFLARCQEEGIPLTEHGLHAALYDKLRDLNAANRNGVWARVIKNAFAPLFVGKVDFVVGNPPWVNWESLPGDYREWTKPLWTRYGLFTLKGHAARLGGGKKDLSMLFVYVAADAYLRIGGTIAFVITQTLFKSREAGEGFRRFRFPRDNVSVHIVPQLVIDMTELHPFAGATNRTATAFFRVSDSAVQWPVPYERWLWAHGPRVADHESWPSVKAGVKRYLWKAKPTIGGASNSFWLTAPEATHGALDKVAGRTEVKAHAGVCTWLNGVFWLKEVEFIKGGRARIVNWHDVGKRHVPQVEQAVEDALVYPLIRGRDVKRWFANPSTHILLTQDPDTRMGVDAHTMKVKYPLTYEYLLRFKEALTRRPGYRKYFDATKDPFWTIYNVGSYSLAKHRVVYKELTDFFQAAVPRNDGKVAIADTKLRFIECQSEDEAHFLCGLLNSSPAVLYLYATANWVQTADYQASDIARVAIPKYKPGDRTHKAMVDLSRKAHALARTTAEAPVGIQEQIDGCAGKIWDLVKAEEEAIRAALDEVGFFRGPAAEDGEDDDDDEERA